jgi:hypothetical protein
VLGSLAGRDITTFAPADEPGVATLFDDFERLVGRVGAAKVLHVLARQFFPLWDNRIATTYGLRLGRPGTNALWYIRFMAIAREQVAALRAADPEREGNLLKALDEYNYARFTRVWI